VKAIICRKLFKVGSEGIQLERKRKFGFIKDVFDEDDGEKTREALSWLQVAKCDNTACNKICYFN